MRTYADQMVTGTEGRQARKRAEVDQLREGLVHVKPLDIEGAVHAVRKALTLAEPIAEQLYGAPFIPTWEALNQLPFWDTVLKVATERPMDRKFRGISSAAQRDFLSRLARESKIDEDMR